VRAPDPGAVHGWVCVDEARLQRRILLAGYPFDGPYPTPDDLEARPGVWAVLVHEEGSTWRPIDVGASDAVVTSLHARRSIGSAGEVGFAAAYTGSDVARRQIEQHVKTRYRLARS
jgi:hypothetical protein